MEQKEKMISKYLKEQERQQFINLISKFPILFISDYSHIRGVGVIQHNTNLKEGIIPCRNGVRKQYKRPSRRKERRFNVELRLRQYTRER